MWETFTLGGTPYPGLPTEQLLDYLSDGKRMEMPAKCPLEVYTIMRDCWINEPDQRPQFRTLTERLVNILEKNTSKVSMLYYIITQVILTFRLVFAYGVLEDRRIDDGSARFKFSNFFFNFEFEPITILC